MWEGHHHSSLMLCGAAVVCLCESEPAPWCCRGAVVLQSPMFVSEVIHVLANRSWWDCKEGRGEEEQQQHIGGGRDVAGVGSLMAFEERGGGSRAAPRSRGL